MTTGLFAPEIVKLSTYFSLTVFLKNLVSEKCPLFLSLPLPHTPGEGGEGCVRVET